MDEIRRVATRWPARNVRPMDNRRVAPRWPARNVRPMDGKSRVATRWPARNVRPMDIKARRTALARAKCPPDGRNARRNALGRAGRAKCPPDGRFGASHRAGPREMSAHGRTFCASSNALGRAKCPPDGRTAPGAAVALAFQRARCAAAASVEPSRAAQRRNPPTSAPVPAPAEKTSGLC